MSIKGVVSEKQLPFLKTKSMKNIIISVHSKIYIFPFKKIGEVMDTVYDFEEMIYVKYVWLIFSITIYKSIKK